MTVPTDRKYAQTHEWFLTDGDVVTIGISQFAADELTDITFVEVPEVGTTFAAGDSVGEIESVKATSEFFSAVEGTITEVNEALADSPQLINDDAFGAGWIAKMKINSPESLATLLDAAAYENFLKNQD